MFNHLNRVLENKELCTLLHEFIERERFDVIHFNNIEGLSLDCLDLKKDFANIKFIYSIHNYNIVCPQVNLWKSERENCEDNNECRDCVGCVFPNSLTKEKEKRILVQQNKVRRAIRGFYRRNIRNKIFFYENKRALVPVKIKNHKNAETYINYLEKARKSVNENVDIILSVSKRTKKIVESRGIRNEGHYVSYIGTKIANEYSIEKIKSKINCLDSINNTESYLSIAYMGYMRHDKGFWWLIYAIEQMPSVLKHRIKLTIAAKTNNPEQYDRIKHLESDLNQVTYFNGYSHDDYNIILDNVDIGVIPVLWEDCLPQVAIEFISNGVPILTSDLGGAHELIEDNDFIFINKNLDDFYDKLLNLLINKKSILKRFYEHSKKPVTVEEHINELLGFYQNN